MEFVQIEYKVENQGFSGVVSTILQFGHFQEDLKNVFHQSS